MTERNDSNWPDSWPTGTGVYWWSDYDEEDQEILPWTIIEIVERNGNLMRLEPGSDTGFSVEQRGRYIAVPRPRA